MVLPDLNDGRLPPGDWKATLDEVELRFAYNFRRREIMAGLRHVVAQLQSHGIEDVWVDGSFVTDKQRPNDVDVVYMIPTGEDEADWPDVGPSRRQHVKRYHRVDLWRYPALQPAKKAIPGLGGGSITIKQFFESDEDGNPRGLVNLVLGEVEVID